MQKSAKPQNVYTPGCAGASKEGMHVKHTHTQVQTHPGASRARHCGCGRWRRRGQSRHTMLVRPARARAGAAGGPSGSAYKHNARASRRPRGNRVAKTHARQWPAHHPLGKNTRDATHSLLQPPAGVTHQTTTTCACAREPTQARHARTRRDRRTHGCRRRRAARSDARPNHQQQTPPR